MFDFTISSIIIWSLGSLGFVICLLMALLRIFTSEYPDILRHESEHHFYTSSAHSKAESEAFPLLDGSSRLDSSSKYLSVVVPAYNEEQRLPLMLDECLDYLARKEKEDSKFSYEVIIVDDGSSDKTTQVALSYTDRLGSDKLRVLTLATNRGKGGAVRLGVLSSRGELILFADADGATKFSDLDKLIKEYHHLSTERAIICGSRAHLEQESIVKRSIFRTFLMRGFHYCVFFVGVRSVKDTQCGFKLVSRTVASSLFNNLHVERWAFDVELLYLGQHFKIPISEVAVNWHEVAGSKIIPVWSWLQMGRDLLLIKLRYTIGAWKIKSDSPKKDQ